MRYLLYFFTGLIDDIDTQKKGLVSVYFPDPNKLSSSLSNEEGQRALQEALRAFPIRWSAVHVGLPDSHRMFASILLFILLGQDQRLRVKLYQNFSTEEQYQLMSFGIPVHELPLTSSGTLKTKNHVSSLKTRIVIERIRRDGGPNSFTGIVHPAVYDVVFSRGGNPHHPGNIELHQAITSRIPAFIGTNTRKVKKELREEVIESVRARGGRFLLLQKDGYWAEITDEAIIHDKVSAAVYENTRKHTAILNQQISTSDTNKFLDPNKRRKIDNDSFCCGIGGMGASGRKKLSFDPLSQPSF